MLLLGVGEGSAYISSSPLPCKQLNCVFDSIKRPFGQADLRAFHQIHVWATPSDQARQSQPHVLHEKKAVGMALSHGTAEPEAGCYGE